MVKPPVTVKRSQVTDVPSNAPTARASLSPFAEKQPVDAPVSSVPPQAVTQAATAASAIDAASATEGRRDARERRDFRARSGSISSPPSEKNRGWEYVEFVGFLPPPAAVEDAGGRAT